MPFWFGTEEELDAAVADVAALSPAARTLLSKAVETQGYDVTKASPASRTLEDLGFLFVRELTPYDTTAHIRPSLWGEEALDAYETRKEAGAAEAAAAKVRRRAGLIRPQAV